MRVLFSKIHCPSFICFCKPSSHLYKPGPLKLENTPPVVSPTCVSVSVPIASDDHLSTADENPIATIEVKEANLDESPKTTIEVKEGDLNGIQQSEIILKSSLKKAVPLGTDTLEEVMKKRVQWMDHLGDELLEIKEFEASTVNEWKLNTDMFYDYSEEDDNDNEGENRSCVCVIL